MKGGCFRSGCILMFLTVFLVLPISTFAAHPLVTDDAGTLGKGRFQLEVQGDYSHDELKEYDDLLGQWVTTKTTAKAVATHLSWGILKNLDLILGIPYQWQKVKQDDVVISDEHGIADMSVALKWRIWEKGGFAFALKPGMTLPTGDEGKGLGPGRPSYGLTFITTKEFSSIALHLNLGYTYQDYKQQGVKDASRSDLWHGSLAAELAAAKNLKLVANVGIDTNQDKASSIHPAFVLGGFIYSLAESLDLSLGVMGGLNKTAPDYTITAGMAWRF